MKFVITDNIFTVPSAVELNTSPIFTDTAITISGSVPDDSLVTTFVVKWQRHTSIGCSNKDRGSITKTSISSSYRITGLEPGNRYTITVTALNGAGSAVSNAVTATTTETGEREKIPVNIPVFTVSLYTQLPLVVPTQ